MRLQKAPLKAIELNQLNLLRHYIIWDDCTGNKCLRLLELLGMGDMLVENGPFVVTEMLWRQIGTSYPDSYGIVAKGCFLKGAPIRPCSYNGKS